MAQCFHLCLTKTFSNSSHLHATWTNCRLRCCLPKSNHGIRFARFALSLLSLSFCTFFSKIVVNAASCALNKHCFICDISHTLHKQLHGTIIFKRRWPTTKVTSCLAAVAACVHVAQNCANEVSSSWTIEIHLQMSLKICDRKQLLHFAKTPFNNNTLLRHAIWRMLQ